MPGYRAHPAGLAALVVEFGEQINPRFGAWDLARGPTDVCQENTGGIIGGIR
jgi:hypothetical protein